MEVAACTWHLTFVKIVCVDQKRIVNNRNVEWMWKLDSMQHRFILTGPSIEGPVGRSGRAKQVAWGPSASEPRECTMRSQGLAIREGSEWHM